MHITICLLFTGVMFAGLLLVILTTKMDNSCKFLAKLFTFGLVFSIIWLFYLATDGEKVKQRIRFNFETSTISTSSDLTNGIYYLEMQARDTGGYYIAVTEKLEVEATNKVMRMLITKNGLGTNKFLVNFGMGPVLDKPQGFLSVSEKHGLKIFQQIDPFAP